MDGKRILKLYDNFLKSYHGNHKEEPLLRLLKEFEKKVITLLEDENPQWFHKAWRQSDVTGNAHIDMAIWQYGIY